MKNSKISTKEKMRAKFYWLRLSSSWASRMPPQCKDFCCELILGFPSAKFLTQTPISPPLRIVSSYYVVMSDNNEAFVLCAYLVSAQALKPGDMVCIAEPLIQKSSISKALVPDCPSPAFEFTNVIVRNPMHLLVNGKVIPSGNLISPSIKVQLFF